MDVFALRETKSEEMLFLIFAITPILARIVIVAKSSKYGATIDNRIVGTLIGNNE